MHCKFVRGSILVCAGLLAIVTAGCGSSASPGTTTSSSSTRTTATGPPESSVASLASPGPESGCPSSACSSVLSAVLAATKLDNLPADLIPPLGAVSVDLNLPQGGKCQSIADPPPGPNYSDVRIRFTVVGNPYCHAREFTCVAMVHLGRRNCPANRSILWPSIPFIMLYVADG